MKEYKIVRLGRGKNGEGEAETDGTICDTLNQLAKKGWTVVQDLNQMPACHKFLLEQNLLP